MDKKSDEWIALRNKAMEKMRKIRESRKANPTAMAPPPIYDEVYFKGMEDMNNSSAIRHFEPRAFNKEATKLDTKVIHKRWRIGWAETLIFNKIVGDLTYAYLAIYKTSTLVVSVKLAYVPEYEAKMHLISGGYYSCKVDSYRVKNSVFISSSKASFSYRDETIEGCFRQYNRDVSGVSGLAMFIGDQ
jgi:hypothetical protein